MSPVYLLGVSLHRLLYEWRIIAPFLPNQPTLVLGNLHAGGTGKTPIALWLMEKLQPHTEHLAYVSRGYGRKTKEARIVHPDDTSEDVGDEALMVRRHFGHSNDVEVVVAHRRRDAFPLLPPKCPVLLDDALQHWDLKAPISVLICPYGKWYTQEKVLPAGPLRESPRGADRASAVLITRCPYPLDAQEKWRISQELGLGKHQKLFAAQECMGEPMGVWGASAWRGDETALVFSGIGEPAEFEAFSTHPDRFHQGGVAAVTLRFEDHQDLDEAQCSAIAEAAFHAGCNALITTSKDLARLPSKPKAWADLQVYRIPHEADLGADEIPFLLWLKEQWKAHGYRVPLPV
ncbi:MAG: hypothetical protein RL168_794 [Bacteroidota bacterium]